MGICITMYVKKGIQQFITDMATSVVKLGIGDTFGNKGACCIRLKYRDSTLCFACCHLESGRSEKLQETRRGQIETLIQKSFMKERGTANQKYDWQSHDVKIIFGDLNFRTTLDLQEEKCQQLVE